MSADIAGEATDAAPVAPESPQPLQLTTSNSSRCTSPLSPPSDPNASASSVDEEVSLNLSVPKVENAKANTVKRSSSISSNHMNSNNYDPTDLSSHSRKIKADHNDVSSRTKSKPSSHYLSNSLDNTISQSSDILQLLLEYRHVLLDVLSKSILCNDNDSNTDATLKGVVLPLKCQCGFNSKICNQVTRSSTYVHQLELRFHSLMESAKSGPEIKYTPKRPWFINSALPFMPFNTGKSSLLDKKKVPTRLTGAEKPIMLFSGNSSINSSVNGDEDDSDEDDVNDDNLSEKLHASYGNGLEELNGGGKTILEGYLESLKNHPGSEDGSDDEKEQGEDEDDEINGNNNEDDPNRGPGRRIDMPTKKLVLYMLQSGASITTISKQIGISRKSVRKIISNYKSFGMLEKKREPRVQNEIQDLILKLYSQGRSYAQISRATTVSKPTISKIIKQYIDSNIYTKGPTNSVTKNNNGPPAPHSFTHPDMFGDSVDDEMDEEKEMIVDEDVIDEDEEQDIDDEDTNEHVQTKSDINATIVPSYPQLQNQKAHLKSRKNMSLIQGPYNGYSQSSKTPNMTNGNRLSLIKQPDRFKPYEVKARHSSPAELPNQALHRNKSNSIVPPLPSSTNIYQLPRQQMKVNNNNNSHTGERDNAARVKPGKLSRHSGELSIKESLIVPEADKNNNTTLANCNVTITSTSNGNHSFNGNANPIESASLLPPIPASLIEGNSDSEANLVPKNFIEGFPAGIMNSLNPNRATKLTLEDFNIVWQLRSQHWTHNQIRKYFQQRGKSISKSSISRIMNGKQRNFQQFFNVVPSNL